MQKFMKALAAIMLMVVALCAACTKDPENGGGNNNAGSGGGGGNANDHAFVDLGLPSGTLWATCNVGADTPEGYGDYFAWGETSPKTAYFWSTYKYCNGGEGLNTLTKYCSKPSCGYNGFTDNLTMLQSGDDAATVNWGNGWSTPTEEQWLELEENTTRDWTTRNDVYGLVFYGNGQSLFLPAAGLRCGSSLDDAGLDGYYWSSSLSLDFPDRAWGFNIYSGPYNWCYYYRYYGQSVRAVRSVRQS